MRRLLEPFRLLLAVALLTTPVAAQNGGAPQKSPPDGQGRVVRVGVALMTNQSRRAVSPKWERDQLVRELRSLRTDRKSSIIIESVPLEASSRQDAGSEAAKKDCQYFVVTTLLDVGHGPGFSVGPGGVHPTPVIIGNADPDRRIAMDFLLLEIGNYRTKAEGRATAPDEDNNDTRAADEAMRIVSVRVATKFAKIGLQPSTEKVRLI